MFHEGWLGTMWSSRCPVPALVYDLLVLVWGGLCWGMGAWPSCGSDWNNGIGSGCGSTLAGGGRGRSRGIRPADGMSGAAAGHCPPPLVNTGRRRDGL